MIAAGRAVYLTNDDAGPHLWIIITEQDSNAHVVMVRILTARPYTDKTVVLEAGCHPFVKGESHVDYGGARLEPVSKLRRAIEKGDCKLHEDVSKTLLKRIRVGLLASQRTVHSIKDHCRHHFPKDFPDP